MGAGPVTHAAHPPPATCVRRRRYAALSRRPGWGAADYRQWMQVRGVAGDDWQVLAWLWQCFKGDLAPIVGALPYSDGRYCTAGMPTGSDPDGRAFLAANVHPNTGELAPIGFAVVEGLSGQARLMVALWVAPVARRHGVGRELALDVLGRHRGPWAIPFQDGNEAAALFWRSVAGRAFGPDGWTRERRPVPGKPTVPADHWIIAASG